jgi:ribosome-associated heat shock protein Hsp15
MRIDKWLWAARFFKTRSLAQEQLDKGRVQVNGLVAKPGRELRVGDLVALDCKTITVAVNVMQLSEVRGPAPVAQLLYAETPDSVAKREQLRQAAKAAWAQQGPNAGERPTKRDRRERDGFERDVKRANAPDWNDRWQASINR